MITSNPYNLPDKILKPNQIMKPITLQNKKSRDRSYDYSKEVSTKGIKIESQMKKSMNLQHITSSPNLHTASTSSSTNRPVEPQSNSRPIEYHQTHIPPINETEHDRRIKFLFEKFYQMSEQITNHDSLLNKIVSEKQKTDRNSWDSPFQVNNVNFKESRQKDDGTRNQARSFHLNQVNAQSGMTISGNEAIEQLKKQVNALKQQIFNIKGTISKDREQQNASQSLTKPIKMNGSMEFESINLQRKNSEEISRIYQAIEQIRYSTQQKINKNQAILHKIQGNTQIVSHKVAKAQQRIENMESNIQNHMNLVNQQINNALTKIVASINDKISKALENNVVSLNEKLKKNIDSCKALIQDKKNQFTLKPNNIEGKIVLSDNFFLKSSGWRADAKTIKIKIKTAVSSFDEQMKPKGDQSPSRTSDSSSLEEIIISSHTFFIDSEGYLLDENQVYLIDQNNMLLQLDAQKVNRLKEMGMYH